MNRSSWMKVLAILLLAAALTVVSVAAAQGEEPVVVKDAPAVIEKGESASLAASMYESEPNNSFATANLMSWDTVAGKIGSAGDIDFYHVQADGPVLGVVIDIDAASAGSTLDPYVCAYDQDHVEIACNDDSDGNDSLLYIETPNAGELVVDIYIKVREFNHPQLGGNSYTYTLSISDAYFLSAATNGSVGGFAFQAADILAYTSTNGKWLLFLDASDVGITANTNSFDIEPGGAWLAFPKNQTFTGPTGKRYTATPWDVVRFNATQWGPTTRGTFAPSLVLDGDKVGLSASGEKIDAISYWGWFGPLQISTAGAVSVDGGALVGRDEDVLGLDQATGEWSMVFDGSTVPGLGVEDVIAIDHVNASTIWWPGMGFVIQGTGVVDGYSVSQKDVLTYWFEEDDIEAPPFFDFKYNIDAIGDEPW